MRWKPEDVAAFLQKCAERGTVRTHKIRDFDIKPEVPMAPPQIVLKLSERQVLRTCLNILKTHPKVAFAWRQNVGAAMSPGGIAIRFAFRGCSDILGALIGGRFLAVEAKATGCKATPVQESFLRAVNESGGLGVCVDDPQKLVDALEAA